MLQIVVHSLRIQHNCVTYTQPHNPRYEWEVNQSLEENRRQAGEYQFGFFYIIIRDCNKGLLWATRLINY